MDGTPETALPSGLVLTKAGRPLVLVFYDGFEMKADPGLIGWLGSNGRRLARYAWRRLRGTQVHTGFYTAFLALVSSLQQQGCEVRINDFALAARMPDYPIGVAGFPSVMAKMDSLPNPRLFGPGDYGEPDVSRSLATDGRNRILTQPGEWAADLYRPFIGDLVRPWFVGIDGARYPDASSHAKDIDVLIYDKLRWHRETEVPRVLDAVTDALTARGRTYAVLRYGAHSHVGYLAHLRRSRSMIFLCEHETQGIAYQEALSMGVPVLAWDEGVLVDPNQRRFMEPGLVVSSVPYFDARCGETFKIEEGFGGAFDVFWRRLGQYRPRQYVLDQLSPAASASAWLKAYASLTPSVPKGH